MGFSTLPFEIDILQAEIDYGLYRKVSLSTDVDLTALGTTLLYTVPDSFEFIPGEIIGICSAYDAIKNDSFLNVGTNNPNYDDLVSGTSFYSLSAIGDWEKMSFSMMMTRTTPIAATEEVYFNVTTADTGTDFKVDVHLWGYLYSV